MLERPKHPDKLFAVVQVPAVLRRFVQLPAEKGFVFAPLETAIRLHLEDLFPGMTLDYATMFRVTRDSEYEIDDDEVEDLLKAIEESVRKRKRGTAVRLEVEADGARGSRAVLDDVARPRHGCRRVPHCRACSI